MSGLQGFRESAGKSISQPVARVLARTGVTPNILTAIGLVINLISAVTVALGNFLAGGLLVLFSSLFDLLDGAVARHTNKVTRFGALFDSTVDRITEGALFFALVWFYLPQGKNIEVLLAFLAMVGSFLISYIRARAEGLGIECKVGIFTRAERVVILVLGLLLNQMFIALLLLALLTYITVIERMVHVWRESKKLTGVRS
ncbi:MAG: CDP-alcohol phosphatidyltransferase family protein [Chloroflexota bacterium]